ncbi:MAG TPA: hypothetical protein DDZ51_01775 [Planctomycetaceae bacterium]|nr:hypothetical protein [Planctomycetaceae bacterium]
MDTRKKPFSVGCRLCGATDVQLRRGLCSAHFTRFNRKYNKLAEESAQQAEEFEQKCIEQGWILASAKGARPRPDDPFDQIAAEVVAEFDRDLGLAAAREQAEEFKNATKKQAPKKKAE